MKERQTGEQELDAAVHARLVQRQRLEPPVVQQRLAKGAARPVRQIVPADVKHAQAVVHLAFESL